MRIILTGIFTVMTSLLLSCVRKGGEECLSYVRFVYDYNMAFEDLFHNQACKMDLYMFDDNGVFVDLISHELAEGTFERDFRILLPQGLPYPIHFIAWSGVHPETYIATEMVSGVSLREQLIVQLNEHRDNIFEQSLRGLWHGTASKMRENTSMLEEETVIYLTKNTNSFRIILQTIDAEEEKIGVDDFSFTLESVNGSYDHTNAVYYDHGWTYKPFYTTTDDNVGGLAEIHTLRLLENTKNLLTIQYEPFGRPVIEIDLNRYISALKLQSYEWMPLQEYMDREDEYRVIVLLKYIDETWIAEQIGINNWYIRPEQENE